MTGNPSNKSQAPPIALDEKQLMGRIRQIIGCFDSIFAQIAPCQPRKGISPSDSDDTSEQMIAANILTDHQKMAIAQLSGHLMSLHDLVYNVTLQRIHQSSLVAHLPMHLPTRCEEEQLVEVSSSDDHSKVTAAAMQKLRLLQEYLVNELVHSEQLEEKLKTAEYNLLKITDERDNLMKKLAKSSSNSSNNGCPKNSKPSNLKPIVPTHAISSSSDVPSQSSKTPNKPPAVLSSDKASIESTLKKEPDGKKNGTQCESFADSPETLIGRYIRKTFDGRKYFGLVASFTSPYFMIVYEDGDNEELKRHEVTQVLWHELVPSTRVAACERHKKRILAHTDEDLEPIDFFKKPRTSDYLASDGEMEFSFEGNLLDNDHSAEEPTGYFPELAEEAKMKQALINALLVL